jgi:hypothetical protein
LAAERIADLDVRVIVNALVRKGRYLDAAKEARSALDAEWLPFLRARFDLPYGEMDGESLALARLVWRLGSDLVLTTNYDDVLRWSVPTGRAVEFRPITNREADAFKRVLQWRIDAPTVWHLHGRIANADEMILTPDGYERLYPAAGAKAEDEAAH